MDVGEEGGINQSGRQAGGSAGGGGVGTVWSGEGW